MNLEKHVDLLTPVSMADRLIREITPLSDKDCFYIADRYKKEFTYPIHCHEECELNFTAHSKGVKRIVGDSVEVIGDYDLVLITGKELEHVWEQHECSSADIREITIQFSPSLLSEGMLDKNQFNTIRKMMKDAECGIAFSLSGIMEVYQQLNRLTTERDGFYAVLHLFGILYELSKCEYKQLSSSAYAKINNHSDSRRILKVQQYIQENYEKQLSLSELAGLAHMTSSAFSRFFKLHAGKNVTDFIIDYRLGVAARLLVDTAKGVSEICYDCGFNNLSNFNRIFRRKKGCSPKEFRKLYSKKKVVV
ncbi:MAG: AraC family transcriptional regulator [Tannerellaceae bacterium]|nr:AraC family transcriptional regulator [Tannerellaceae bacterium]